MVRGGGTSRSSGGWAFLIMGVYCLGMRPGRLLPLVLSTLPPSGLYRRRRVLTFGAASPYSSILLAVPRSSCTAARRARAVQWRARPKLAFSPVATRPFSLTLRRTLTGEQGTGARPPPPSGPCSLRARRAVCNHRQLVAHLARAAVPTAGGARPGGSGEVDGALPAYGAGC